MKIITEIKGGLGNQLFCYALGYAVSREKNAKFFIDTSMADEKLIKDRNLELLNYDVFFDKRISYRYRDRFFFKKTGINRIVKKFGIGLFTNVYKEKALMQYDSEVFCVSKNTYFDGFWQNYRYFDKYKADFQKMIYPKRTEISESEKNLKEQIENSISVSLHIRRTDYKSLNWTLPMDYYDRAIDYIRGIDKNIRIFVFSDDMEFCKEYAANRQDKEIFTFAEYESDNSVIEDMYLMSLCKYHINANSSYSWWASYLSDNTTVVCPEMDMWCGDYYPKEWIKIKVCREK